MSGRNTLHAIDGERRPSLRAPFIPWCFPEELTADLDVPTGAKLHLRAIRAGDATKLVAFHSQLSSDSIYRRFFSEHVSLTDQEIAHFTLVDYVDRLALVILDGDALVAVGRFDRCPKTAVAEVAFIVRDDYQHLGLGHQLLAHLSRAAWARGITTFCAETLFTNIDMISVFRHSGFPVTSSVAMGEVNLRFPIKPTDESAALRDKYAHASA